MTPSSAWDVPWRGWLALTPREPAPCAVVMAHVMSRAFVGRCCITTRETSGRGEQGGSCFGGSPRCALTSGDARTGRGHAHLMQGTIPAQMKAAALDQYGGPEVLHAETLPVPRPRSTQALDRLDSAGVGVWGPYTRAGELELGPGGFPLVIGSSASTTSARWRSGSTRPWGLAGVLRAPARTRPRPGATAPRRTPGWRS